MKGGRQRQRNKGEDLSEALCRELGIGQKDSMNKGMRCESV